MHRNAFLVLAFALAACSSSPSSPDTGGVGPDSGADTPDAAPSLDGGDAAPPSDGSVGPAHDASTSADGGGSNDAGGPSTAAPIAEQASFTTLYAMSDVHGHYAELGALLVKYGLIASVPAQPGGMVWTGGDATLVVDGDMIDKGPSSLEVIEAVMALQASAPASGGSVIALFGNHEAEFLGDPTGSKFTGTDRIDSELAAQSPAIDPTAFASGADPRGAWTRKLPFGARVGAWFFSHAGDTGGLTIAQLDAELSAAVASAQGWNSTAITGSSSLLESRTWYTPSVVSTNAAALGVKHIIMGHDPNAFGSIGQMLAPNTYQGALMKIDTGLGSDASSGALLRVRHDGANDVAEALLPDGTIQSLRTGSP